MSANGQFWNEPAGDLRLYEQLLLLALHDEKGTLQRPSADLAVAAAAMTDLIRTGRVSVEDSNKALVDVTDPSPTGDRVLDECLDKIRAGKRRASLKTWIERLSRIKDLRHAAAGRLVDRGIVRVEEKSTLGLFSSTRYPEVDPVPEEQLVARLREAIFTDSVDVDGRTCLLVSLANATNLLDRVFDAKKIRRRKERIELLADDESIGAATKRALDALNASVFVTTVAVTG